MRPHPPARRWKYIRDNNLQDAKERSNIHLNSTLEEVRPPAAAARPGASGSPSAARPLPHDACRPLPTPPPAAQLFNVKGTVKHTALLRLVQPHLSKLDAAAPSEGKQLQ